MTISLEEAQRYKDLAIEFQSQCLASSVREMFETRVDEIYCSFVPEPEVVERLQYTFGVPMRITLIENGPLARWPQRKLT